ncbi:MAG: PQQ-binding-like beta-propeller repeat protein [Vulcanimicrobiaceae bacterium]
MEFVRGIIAILLVIVVACAPAAPTESALAIGNAKAADWSRYVTGAIENSKIYQGVVFFGLSRLDGTTSTQAYDVRTGRRLWKQTGAYPLSGSSLFLAVGTAVEHVDAHTGRTIWRSVPLCVEPRAATPKRTGIHVEFGLPVRPSPPPALAAPTYVVTIGKTLYVGCNGGKIVALHLSNGRVFASAHPAHLDEYDQIVSLGHDALGISGRASGAYMFRQSAIVKRDTLATIVVFGPDHRIIGTHDGDAIIADVCCQGTHSDSWPADIERVSLTSGETMSDVSLHPYPHPLPPDRDLPGPGLVLAVGNDLYVATHSALFVYDLRHLRARPRVVYADLVSLPTFIIDRRYLSIEEGKPGTVRRVALLDAYNGMRVIETNNTGGSSFGSPRGSTRQIFTFSGSRIRFVTVDASCDLSATSKTYAFMICRNLDIASHAHLGGPPRVLRLGLSTENPESIAVYAVPDP